MIDAVVILNLPRCTDRKDHCISKLIKRGTPLGKVRVSEAKADPNYEKIYQACEAAIADGFSEFGVLWVGNRTHIEKNGIKIFEGIG